jgi:hypothetical protein
MKNKKALLRPGVQETMKQGSNPDRGSAALVGNTRGIMRQGTTPRHAATTPKLGKLMGQ